MLTSVEARNDQGDLLELPFQDISSGFAIEDIDGLDPVKATLVSSPFAQVDGSQFQASRREARNLIFTLSFEPDYVSGSIEELRDKLYQFFMTETKVNLRFIRTGKPDVYIDGTVESFDAPRFLQTLKATISVMCFKPDFLELEPTTFSESTTATSDEDDLIYYGSVETGVKITVNVNRTVSIDDTLSIFFRDPGNNTRKLDFAYDMVSGDTLVISTVVGSKSATLTHAGVPTNVLQSVAPSSQWLNLFRGVNGIRVYLEGAAIPFTIEYTTRYGGL